jgi:hypothetical protein
MLLRDNFTAMQSGWRPHRSILRYSYPDAVKFIAEKESCSLNQAREKLGWALAVGSVAACEPGSIGRLTASDLHQDVEFRRLLASGFRDLDDIPGLSIDGPMLQARFGKPAKTPAPGSPPKPAETLPPLPAADLSPAPENPPASRPGPRKRRQRNKPEYDRAMAALRLRRPHGLRETDTIPSLVREIKEKDGRAFTYGTMKRARNDFQKETGG